MKVVSRILTVSALAAFTLSALAQTPIAAQATGKKMSKPSMMSKSKMSKSKMTSKSKMSKSKMHGKSMVKKPMKAPIMTGDATKSGGGPQLNPVQNGPGTRSGSQGGVNP